MVRVKSSLEIIRIAVLVINPSPRRCGLIFLVRNSMKIRTLAILVLVVGFLGCSANHLPRDQELARSVRVSLRPRGKRVYCRWHVCDVPCPNDHSKSCITSREKESKRRVEI